jgi:virginiamycin B lyase
MAAAVVTSVAFSVPRAGADPLGTFTQYPIGNGRAVPEQITMGPDGALWFTEFFGNKIGRLTPSGQLTEYAGLSLGSCYNSSEPYGITPGPDGNLWFTEVCGNRVGWITPQGQVSELLIPTANAAAFEITPGPDGNLWFTESNAVKVGTIILSLVRQWGVDCVAHGCIVDWPVPAVPFGIAGGPAGDVWFTEPSAIARMSTSGRIIARYPTATPDAGPDQIVTASNNALVFTEYNANANAVAGLVTTDNWRTAVVTEYRVPTRNSEPEGLALDLPRGVWFTEPNANKVGELTASGRVCEFPDPARLPIPIVNPLPGFPQPFPYSLQVVLDRIGPDGIALGPSGTMWFAEVGVNAIAKIGTTGSGDCQKVTVVHGQPSRVLRGPLAPR